MITEIHTFRVECDGHRPDGGPCGVNLNITGETEMLALLDLVHDSSWHWLHRLGRRDPVLLCGATHREEP